MKLRQLFEQSGAEREKEFAEWIAANNTFTDEPHQLEYKNLFKMVRVEDGSELTLRPVKDDTWPEFNPPSFIDSNDWTNLDFSATLAKYTLKNFKRAPNVKILVIESCKVESFDGIDKLDQMETLAFEGPFRGQKTLPVLRLLKCPKLKRIRTAWHSEKIPILPKEVVSILVSHLEGDKSIPECQQELIEEGFEAYAKL